MKAGDYVIAITQKEFSQLSSYIKSNYGIYLKDTKKVLVEGRLQSVLEDMGFQNFSDYYDYVLSDKSGHAVVMLLDKITTNHTYFMREFDHFYFFRDEVLPYLAKTVKEKDLRIWCAACSSGEEAYTLAMILDEYFNSDKMFWDTKILATDISNAILETAKNGIYSPQKIEPLPKMWKLKYFKVKDSDYIVTDSIKNQVIYRKFNLMDKMFPFKKKFHTIFCRNVMIYFDNATKTELIERLYNSLEYGGYLFIGHSESIDRTKCKFKYVMPSVYRKE